MTLSDYSSLIALLRHCSISEHSNRNTFYFQSLRVADKDRDFLKRQHGYCPLGFSPEFDTRDNLIRAYTNLFNSFLHKKHIILV